MKGEPYLFLPGPTPVPERVARAMNRSMINHRGEEFKEILYEVLTGIKQIYRTSANVLIYSSSGTGGLEAAVVNFISPGDKVLAVSIGVFGDRFASIAGRFGAQVDKIDFPWGSGADPQIIRERLQQDKQHQIKAVLISQNETSTGAYNDIQAVRTAMGDHPALLMVDAVSGLAAVDLRMDEWGLDVVVSASQKAFMIPPGLSFIAFNDRAYQVYKTNTNTRYYWDLAQGMEYLQKGQTPFTPPISLVYGMQEALKMMAEEGLEQIIARHFAYRDMVRDSIRAMGLGLLAEDGCASPAVTSVIAPAEIGANPIRKYMLDHFNVILSGGQQRLDNVIFRIGHLGYIRDLDLLAVLAALEITLTHFGVPLHMGAGLRAAQQAILTMHKH